MDINLDVLTETVIKEIYNNLKNEKKPKILISKQNYYNVSDYEVDYIEDFKNIDKIYEYEFIILTNLSNNDLVDISFGKYSNETSKCVIYALLNDKRIMILKEGIEFNKYRDVCNEKFYDIMNDYVTKISKLGINVVTDKYITKVLSINSYVDSELENLSTHKKLITFEIAESISKLSSEIVLKKEVL